MTQNELATRLMSLKELKAQLEAAVKETNKEIEDVERELSNLMLDEGNDAFELNGYKFSVEYKDMFSCTVDKREALLDALKLYGFNRDEVVTETIPAPKLNKIMKTICDDDVDNLPEEFEDIVTTFTKQGISVRKVSGKSGRSKTGKTF